VVQPERLFLPRLYALQNVGTFVKHNIIDWYPVMILFCRKMEWSVHGMGCTLRCLRVMGMSKLNCLNNFTVDNLTVAHVVQSSCSQEPHLVHLIRFLVLFATFLNFWFSAGHIEGESSTHADSLSIYFYHRCFRLITVHPPQPSPNILRLLQFIN